MSDRPVKVIVNITNGTEEVIPLTDEEVAELEVAKALAEEARVAKETAAIAAAEAAAAAKASGIAKLLALGLTEEEANALVK